jgi:hypothetical protein
LHDLSHSVIFHLILIFRKNTVNNLVIMFNIGILFEMISNDLHLIKICSLNDILGLFCDERYKLLNNYVTIQIQPRCEWNRK